MTSMHEKGRCFADTVNSSFSALFDVVINNEDLLKGSEADFARGLEKYFAEARENWYAQKQEELDGEVFADYLESLEEEELLSFLRGFFEKLDYEYPVSLNPLIEKLSPRGRETYLGMILSISPEIDSSDDGRLEDLYLLRQLLPLASVWQDDDVSRKLLDWYLEAENPNETTAEELGRYFRKIGGPAAEVLGERIREEVREKRASENGTDYLLQDLTYICKQDDALRGEAYLVLREAFRGMEQKQIAAICLGDLGSLRAIPLLRSYIERNYKSIERHLYYDILSSIQRLGGSTKDLPDPFGDFSAAGAPGAYNIEI